MSRETGGLTDRQIHRQTNGQTGRTGGQTEQIGQTHTDRQTNGQNRRTDRTDRQTDKRTNGQTDRKNGHTGRQIKPRAADMREGWISLYIVFPCPASATVTHLAPIRCLRCFCMRCLSVGLCISTLCDASLCLIASLLPVSLLSISLLSVSLSLPGPFLSLHTLCLFLLSVPCSLLSVFCILAQQAKCMLVRVTVGCIVQQYKTYGFGCYRAVGANAAVGAQRSGSLNHS